MNHHAGQGQGRVRAQTQADRNPKGKEVIYFIFCVETVPLSAIDPQRAFFRAYERITQVAVFPSQHPCNAVPMLCFPRIDQ
jgi:hypothetical protein